MQKVPINCESQWSSLVTHHQMSTETTQSVHSHPFYLLWMWYNSIIECVGGGGTLGRWCGNLLRPKSFFYLSWKNRQNQKPKAELRLAQMTESDVKLVYFTSKELVSFFLFFDPKGEPRRNIFFCFSFMPDEKTKQKSNSQVNNCHRQPTALHYCLLHTFTFAAFHRGQPNVSLEKVALKLFRLKRFVFFLFHSSPMNSNICSNLKVSQWMHVRYRWGLYRLKSWRSNTK